MDFVFPYKTKSISVTGSACSLNCAHCNRHYLNHMTDIHKFLNDGDKTISSVLVSGGCNENGEVPLLDYRTEIQELRKDYRIIAHTGLLPPEKAEAVGKYADVVSFDFPPSTRAIEEVFGIARTQEDYIDSLAALKKHVTVVPHMVIGLENGRIEGEYKSLETLSGLGFTHVVCNVFIPTNDTKFEKCTPPGIGEVISVLMAANKKFNRVTIGCMRPAGEYRQALDSRALDYIDAIVMPDRELVARTPNAKTLNECCAL